MKEFFFPTFRDDLNLCPVKKMQNIFPELNHCSLLKIGSIINKIIIASFDPAISVLYSTLNIQILFQTMCYFTR